MKLVDQLITDQFAVYCGDAVQLITEIPSESIGFSIFSPPFKDLYVYSDNLEDLGNSRTDEEFYFPFQIICNELHRVMWSGRNVAIHCMDLPAQKGKDGYIGLKDFSGSIIKLMQNAGFIYHSRITIWRNPVTEMQRTKALGLLHKQIKKDAAMSRVGNPDYLLIFRKPGDALHPVVHQDKDSSNPNYLPVELWQKYASPVWMDIDYSDTLNGKDGREENDERHICCLQLPTIERAVHLWTNENDTVLTMFAGVGSEVYQAVKMGRYGIGFELKASYYELMKENLRNLTKTMNQKTLFDL